MEETITAEWTEAGKSGKDDGLVSERADAFSPPSLQGKHVYLRVVVPDDYPYLHLLETSGELASTGGLRGTTPSFQDWLQQRAVGILAQFIVLARDDNSRIGLTSVFSANFQDGHAHLAATRFNPNDQSPLMLMGFGLFVDYVFSCWNFRKLYLDSTEFNYPQFASGIGRIFSCEGRLREHHFLNGQFWDHLILAIYKDRWSERSSSLLRVERQ